MCDDQGPCVLAPVWPPVPAIFQTCHASQTPTLWHSVICLTWTALCLPCWLTILGICLLRSPPQLLQAVIPFRFYGSRLICLVTGPTLYVFAPLFISSISISVLSQGWERSSCWVQPLALNRSLTKWVAACRIALNIWWPTNCIQLFLLKSFLLWRPHILLCVVNGQFITQLPESSSIMWILYYGVILYKVQLTWLKLTEEKRVFGLIVKTQLGLLHPTSEYLGLTPRFCFWLQLLADADFGRQCCWAQHLDSCCPRDLDWAPNFTVGIWGGSQQMGALSLHLSNK